MKYLIDTNVFLEGLLEQEKANEVRSFFLTINLSQMAITDFSLHSVGVVLFRLRKTELFISFLEDMIINGIELLSLGSNNLIELERVAKRFDLDFDDAYQYLVSLKYKLQIISFDTDFDRTERGKITPSEVKG